MKSSTVRRSALSRESMNVIGNLASETPTDYNQYVNNSEYSAPSEYYREVNNTSTNNKSKEIDLLWQTFKSAQFSTNSAFMHVLGGFILGVIVTSVTISLFGMFAANSDNPALKNKFAIFGSKPQIQKIDENTEEAAEFIKDNDQETGSADTSVILTEKVSNNDNENITEDNTRLQVPVKTKKYIIKDGDTVEAIIKRNYGSYTPERAEAVMKANHLKDLDHISIDQELLLPVEE